MVMKEWIQNMHHYFIMITIKSKQSLKESKHLVKEIRKKNSLK
jgi:hypothetical protein